MVIKTGDSNKNTLVGTSGNDELYGLQGDDTLIGSGGQDLLNGGTGSDKMEGGTGDDTYYVDSTGDQVVEQSGGGKDTVYASINYTLGSQVENLILTGTALIGLGNSLDNIILGTSGANHLLGGGGADTLKGGGGDDYLHGGGGADTMVGGAGNDDYFVDDAGDVITEFAPDGIDTVESSISYALGENVENLILTGTANLLGTGNDLDNEMIGNSGRNTLDGGAGADAMRGGAGNDWYVVDHEDDVVTEYDSQGHDAVVVTGIDYTLPANVEDLYMLEDEDTDGYGNGLDNHISGTSGDNTLVGYDGDDFLDGGPGLDTLVGGTGDDFYTVANGPDFYQFGFGGGDLIIEAAGEGTSDKVLVITSYILPAAAEVEFMFSYTGTYSGILQGNGFGQTLTGNNGDNILSALGGNDTINGGGGFDQLYGGAGVDVLTGGAGDDRFVFEAGLAHGDTVVDYVGNGDAAGDTLYFLGYGPGATFTQVDNSSWQVTYNGGASVEVIQFLNGGATGVHPSDIVFI